MGSSAPLSPADNLSSVSCVITPLIFLWRSNPTAVYSLFYRLLFGPGKLGTHTSQYHPLLRYLIWACGYHSASNQRPEQLQTIDSSWSVWHPGKGQLVIYRIDYLFCYFQPLILASGCAGRLRWSWIRPQRDRLCWLCGLSNESPPQRDVYAGALHPSQPMCGR